MTTKKPMMDLMLATLASGAGTTAAARIAGVHRNTAIKYYRLFKDRMELPALDEQIRCFTFRIRKKYRNELTLMAAADGVTVDAILESAIKSYIEKRELAASYTTKDVRQTQ